MSFCTSPAQSLHALRDVTFSARRGEFVTVVGPSGCGKSTLLRLVADLVQPTQGRIRINGKEPRQARLDREYSYVFQRPVLFEWRTVRENVRLPLEVMGVAAGEQEARVTSLLELVQLTNAAHLSPWQLSGGMQQRVSLARALSTGPSVLLLDEPFGALDEMAREALQEELLRVCAATAVTTLLVTHSVTEAVFLSDRVLVMGPGPGHVEQDLAIDLPRPRTPELRLSTAFFESVTAVRRHLTRRL